MANFTGLAAGRYAVLSRAGWDVHRDGLTGGPRVHVLVGAERHDDRRPRAALSRPRGARLRSRRRPGPNPRRRPGRARSTACRQVIRSIVCLQAGNLHSGAFDPFVDAIAAAHRRTAPGCTSTARSGCGRRPRRRCGSWSPAWRPPTPGRPTPTRRSTSPYDCGIADRRRPDRGARGVRRAHQLPRRRGRRDPATPTRRCRSSPGAPAACRSGRRSARSAAPASPTWSTGSSPAARADRGRLRRRSPAPRCSTTSSTRRCACLRRRRAHPRR